MTDNKHCYDYARPAVTVDAVVFMRDGDIVKLLLIQRKNEPFRGGWALPGGYIEMAETTEEAVHRELQEETGLIGVDLQRVDVFDAIYRDPRDRIISVAYAGCICADHAASAKHGDDAQALAWHDLNALPDLAFDHGDIVRAAREKLNI